MWRPARGSWSGRLCFAAAFVALGLAGNRLASINLRKGKNRAIFKIRKSHPTKDKLVIMPGENAIFKYVN